MFRVSQRSISGPSHRYGHPSLTRRTANLRQFHHISALYSEFDTKPDTKSTDTFTESTKSTAKGQPSTASNQHTSWSSRLLSMFGIRSNSPASSVSQVTPSHPAAASQTPPASQTAPASLSPHLRSELMSRCPQTLRRHKRKLCSSISSKLPLYQTAEKETTEKDLTNPDKRAELLSLLDDALECAQDLVRINIALEKKSHDKIEAQEGIDKNGAKRMKLAKLFVRKSRSQVDELQKQRTQLLLKFSSATTPDAGPDISTQRDTAQRATAQRDTAPRDTAPRDTAQRDTAQRDTAQRDTAQRDTAQRDTAQRDTAQTGHSVLSLDSKQNIVAQILESSSKNAPAAAQIETDPKIEESKEPGKESLAHVSKYIESKSRGQLSSRHLRLTALDAPMPPVPGVSFGLDRVLFNPGVYHLRDPRSRVYNFDPYLSDIMPVSEFDFTTLKPYVTSSKDVVALEMSAKHHKKYYGSSSSMTSALSHFHYLLSAWRPLDARYISKGFEDPLRSFTRLLRAPIAMFLHYKEKEDIYAIDADKEFDSSNILMHLGKSMEKLLTLPKEEFERYRRSSDNKITAEEEESVPESYHYTSIGNFLMRSQLDAYDPRLPGTGMYDLKTRAVVSIRMDASNPVDALGYEIRDRFGNYKSYEREYFDMIRAAFLKYSLQVRIGRMDGIFVAYHNIERIFGFQYISLPEMDQSLHGQNDTTLGDKEFELSLGLWEKVLDRATAKFPKQSLRFHFETREGPTPWMYIFAQPVTDEQIHEIQTKNQAQIEAMQERLFNPGQPRSQVMDLDDWVEPEVSPDESSEAESSEDLTGDITQDPDYDENLLAMTLVTKSTVNGQPVERPMNFGVRDEWRVTYELNDLSTKQGNALLKLCKMRRAEVLDKGEADDSKESNENHFFKLLSRLAQEGREFRQKENHRDRRDGITVYKEQKQSV